jgi:glutaconyl-CoA decarboxylase
VRRYTVTVDGTPFTIDVEETAADRFTVRVGDRILEATLASDEDLPGAVIGPGMPLPEEPRPHAGTPTPSPVSSLSPVSPVPSFSPAAGSSTGVATPSAPVQPASPSGLSGVAGGSPRVDVLASPMPGVILEVHVKAGTVLRRGDPVLVLEAMKMRNTIRAPRASVVVSVEVEAGQPVGPGDALVRLGAVAG